MLTDRVGPEGARAAALIWARATTRRDGTPRTVEDTTPGIRRRLAVPRSTLLVTRRDDTPVGFTLFAPRGETVEVFYLATDPDAWGGGVASHLLARVDTHARILGRETLELWVINDNQRAIDVYGRAGWVGTEEEAHDPTSGRIERRFVRHLG